MSTEGFFMIKIENKKLNIQIFDKVYAISKPKFKEVIQMKEMLESMNEKEKFNFIEQKLISYGIPQDVLDELDGDAYVELLEVVNGSKKN